VLPFPGRTEIEDAPAQARRYVPLMPSQISHGASGAIRRFAGWVARGSVGYPMLEGINYWDAVAESPSQLEICFAIFANVLELDDQGDRSTISTPSAAPPRGLPVLHGRAAAGGRRPWTMGMRTLLTGPRNCHESDFGAATRHHGHRHSAPPDVCRASPDPVGAVRAAR
jgi:hypothetical protein